MSMYLYFTQEAADAWVAAGLAHTKDGRYYVENVEIRIIPPFKEQDTLRGHRLTDQEACNRMYEEADKARLTREQLTEIDILLEKLREGE